MNNIGQREDWVFILFTSTKSVTEKFMNFYKKITLEKLFVYILGSKNQGDSS